MQPSKWLQNHIKNSEVSISKKSLCPVYLEDKHQETVFKYLSNVLCCTAPSVPILDRVAYILDVLFPEVSLLFATFSLPNLFNESDNAIIEIVWGQ